MLTRRLCALLWPMSFSLSYSPLKVCGYPLTESVLILDLSINFIHKLCLLDHLDLSRILFLRWLYLCHLVVLLKELIDLFFLFLFSTVYLVFVIVKGVLRLDYRLFYLFTCLLDARFGTAEQDLCFFVVGKYLTVYIFVFAFFLFGWLSLYAWSPLDLKWDLVLLVDIIYSYLVPVRRRTARLRALLGRALHLFISPLVSLTRRIYHIGIVKHRPWLSFRLPLLPQCPRILLHSLLLVDR